MLFRNALILREDYSLHRGNLAVENGVFSDNDRQEEVVDLGGALILPGLIDLHTHGCVGCDFSDGDYDGLLRMARYYAANGTTSFSPASMTLPEDALSAAMRTAERLHREKPADAAQLRAVTMEGPFFCEAKKGAQAAEHLQLPDIDMLHRVQAAAGGLIRIVCVAPELDGAIGFIEQTRREGHVVSLAHTDADYDEAKAGLNAGATHVTHLFNAMPPLLHRKPGVIGAAAETPGVTAELICDGIHIHPSAIRAAFALFGPERIVLVSDSLSACGMAEGEYELGGQKVFVTGRTAVLADGTLAGSVAPLFRCMCNAVEFGIPLPDAVGAASRNPARVLGIDDTAGTIATGRPADFLICSEKLELLDVYIAGRRVKRAG